MDTPTAPVAPDGVQPPAPENPEASPTPVPKKKWKKIILITLGICLGIFLAGCAFLFIEFSGGIDGIVLNNKPNPNPNSSELVAGRKAVKSAIAESFAKFEAKTGLTPYTSTAFHDRCYRGTNNWKIHDGFANKCAYRITKFYGFNGNFTERLLAIEAQIADLHWEYYDMDNPHAIRQNLEDYHITNECLNGTTSEPCDASDLLTTTGYYNQDNAQEQALEIAYGQKETEYTYRLDDVQLVTDRAYTSAYEQRALVDAKTMLEGMTKSNQYMIAVAIESIYYED